MNRSEAGRWRKRDAQIRAKKEITPQMARDEIDRRRRKRAAKAKGEEFTEKAALSDLLALTGKDLKDAAGK